MNGRQVSASLKGHSHTRRHFRGVYSSNTFPFQKRSMSAPRSYVCNLDSSNGPGTHWVALYIPKRGPVEYFDSTGMDLPPELFRRFRPSTNYIYNAIRLQSPFTTVCGQYCLHYLWQRGLCDSMNETLSVFRNYDPFFNDILVNRIVEHVFKVKLNIFNGSM